MEQRKQDKKLCYNKITKSHSTHLSWNTFRIRSTSPHSPMISQLTRTQSTDVAAVLVEFKKCRKDSEQMTMLTLRRRPLWRRRARRRTCDYGKSPITKTAIYSPSELETCRRIADARLRLGHGATKRYFEPRSKKEGHNTYAGHRGQILTALFSAVYIGSALR